MPDGFTGHVIILFEQNDGELGPVFHVPVDGVLKVRGGSRNARSSTVYLYEKKDGDREYIVYLDHSGSGKTLQSISDDEAANKVFAFNDGGVGSFTANNKTIKYRAFFVGYPVRKARMYDAMVDHVFKLREGFVRGERSE